MQARFAKIIENKKLLGTVIILLLVLVWGALNSKFSFDKYDPTADMRGLYDVSAAFTRNSIREYHQFPLWIPYVYGGMPFFQTPQHPIFNIANFLVVLLPTFNMGINILGMIQLFIIGLTVYLLMLEFRLNYKYALIAAFTFMFNRYNQTVLMSGGELHFDSLAWLPAIVLFIVKACKSKNWSTNSILAGIFAAISFHAGDVSVFTYMLFFISLLFAFLFITQLKKYKKIILIFIIFSIVSTGLMAVRLLPLMDFNKVSDLSQGRSFESARGHFLDSANIIDLTKTIIKGFTIEEAFKGTGDIQIGIVVFILALLSLPLIKNRYVLFFVIAILILSSVAAGSQIFYLLWKYFPAFNKQHHISRMLYLIPFCFSVLAGFGTNFFFENIIAKIKIRRYANYIYVALIILLFFTFPYRKPGLSYLRINMEEEMHTNQLMVYLHDIQKQEGLFRVHRWDLFNHIGGSGQALWIPMEISTVHGHLNTFEPKYLFEFINPIAAFNPTKILGIYNTKYFYSTTNISSPDLVFVKEFERCDIKTNPICDENFGPYLYKNKRYVPRAYLVDNALLIIGQKQKAVEAMYMIILNENFNPSNLAIFISDINDINIPLSRFKAIIMLEEPKDTLPFKEYVNNGGILLPNIFEQKTTIAIEEINRLLLNFSSSYEKIKELEITEFKPNSMAIKLDNKEGFAVIAEKYFMYEGWHVKPEKQILRTNGFSSAVWVDKNDSMLRFSYFPKSFKRGLIITAITSVVIIVYFVKKRLTPKDIKRI